MAFNHKQVNTFFSPNNLAMKKYLFLAMALTTLSQSAIAQVPEVYAKQAPDTCINQDTVKINFDYIASNVEFFEVVATRISGTIAANSYVILQGSSTGERWENVGNIRGDSLALQNQVTNSKLWPIDRTYYTSYRAYLQTPSSTVRIVLKFIYGRRPDE